MNYGYAIKRAWEIVWKYKILFLFGILSSCGTTSLQTQYDFSSTSETSSFLEYFESGEIANKISENLMGIVLLSLGILLIGVLIGLVFYAIQSIGKIGIIQGVLQVETMGNEAPVLSFWERMERTKSFLWRFLGMNFLVPLIIFFLPIVLFLGVFLFLGEENFEIIFSLSFCSFVCIYFFIAWIYSFLIILANNSMISEDLSIINALKNGWELFKKNIGVFILISFVGLILGIILYIVIFLPISLIIGMNAFSAGQINEQMAYQWPGLIPISIIIIVIQWFFQTYLQTFWTLLFLEFKKKESRLD